MSTNSIVSHSTLLSLAMLKYALHLEIAKTIHELGSDVEGIKSDPEKLKILFNEMIQMCLWWVSLPYLPLRFIRIFGVEAYAFCGIRGNATVRGMKGCIHDL